MAATGTHSIVGEHESAAICVTPLEGGLVATGSSDHSIRIWDPSRAGNDTCVKELQTGASVFSLAQLEDGRLASGGIGNDLRVWDLSRNPDDACVAELEGHTESISDMRVLRGSRLATASYDGTLRLWEPEGSDLSCTAMDDGRLAAGSYYYKGTIHVWDLSERQGRAYVGAFRTEDPIMHLVTAIDGSRVVSETEHGFQLWDVNLAPSRARRQVVDLGGWSGSMCYLQDGRLATLTADNVSELRMWDVSTLGRRWGRARSSMAYRGDYISARAMCELPGSRLAATDDDGRLHVFQV